MQLRLDLPNLDLEARNLRLPIQGKGQRSPPPTRIKEGKCTRRTSARVSGPLSIVVEGAEEGGVELSGENSDELAREGNGWSKDGLAAPPDALSTSLKLEV